MDPDANIIAQRLLIARLQVEPSDQDARTGLAELTEAEGQAFGLAVTRLSKALKACTGAEKVYAEAYYEVVPHLHMLLTARYPGTPQEFWRWKIGDWPEAPRGGAKEVIDLCDRLRAHLSI